MPARVAERHVPLGLGSPRLLRFPGPRRPPLSPRARPRLRPRQSATSAILVGPIRGCRRGGDCRQGSEEAGARGQQRYRAKPRAGGWRDRFMYCVHSAGGASSAETRLGKAGRPRWVRIIAAGGWSGSGDRAQGFACPTLQ